MINHPRRDKPGRPIQVALTISAERIANLMCSAIESGDPVTTARKGGWCSGIYYRTKRSTPPDGNWYYDRPDFYESKDFQIEVVEVDDEATGHETSHIIRRKELIAGLVTMAKAFPSHFAQILEDNTDAPCADVFLQSICFGKEKYA